MNLEALENIFRALPPLPINPTILWALFGVAVGISALLSVVFVYHWVKFMPHPGRATLVTVVYIVGAVMITFGSFLALGYYHLSIV